MANMILAPGRIRVESIMHETETSRNDITGLLAEFNVNSSVLFNSTFGILTLSDYKNYIANGNMRAGDNFEITINFHRDTIKYRFKLARIEDIKNLQSGRAYNLKLISALEYYSIYRSISKSFVGQTSEIARAILAEHTNEEINIWEPSVNTETVIIPNWSPIKALDWLAKRSRSEDSPSKFTFFQDSRLRYNFLSMEKFRDLYPKPVFKYSYARNDRGQENGLGVNPNSEANMQAIFNLDYLNLYDIRKSYDQGNLRNTKIRADITTKTIDYQQNSYWDTFNRKALNKVDMFPYEDTSPGKIVLEYTSYNSATIGGFGKVSDETTANPDFDRSQQVEITVIGQTGIDIGNVVELDIPSPEPESTRKVADLDQVWSGNYYVISKRDVFDMTGHKMALRLARGSQNYTGYYGK